MYNMYLIKDSHRTYIGYTSDVSRRLRQHNREIKGGARATRGGTWSLVSRVRGFETIGAAMSYEWHWKHSVRGIHRRLEYARGHPGFTQLAQVAGEGSLAQGVGGGADDTAREGQVAHRSAERDHDVQDAALPPHSPGLNCGRIYACAQLLLYHRSDTKVASKIRTIRLIVRDAPIAELFYEDSLALGQRLSDAFTPSKMGSHPLIIIYTYVFPLFCLSLYSYTAADYRNYTGQPYGWHHAPVLGEQFDFDFLVTWRGFYLPAVQQGQWDRWVLSVIVHEGLQHILSTCFNTLCSLGTWRGVTGCGDWWSRRVLDPFGGGHVRDVQGTEYARLIRTGNVPAVALPDE